MKILCVIDCLGSGGAQRQLVGLALAFKEKGHEVTFLVYHEENFFKETLDTRFISVILIEEPNYWKRLVKMRRYIRHGGFDVVISFLDAANFICEMAGLPWKRWKLIVGERSSNPQILTSFKLRLYRWFHIFSDYVVANSEANIQIIKKVTPLISNNKYKVIYNFIDFDKWQVAEDYIPLRKGKLNLVVVASHSKIKNARGLIEAIYLLNDEEKRKISVHWYGKQNLDKSFEEANDLIMKYSLQHIFTFHLPTKDIVEIMNYADVIGLFSLFEGLPNVICEAMALNKPIIASSVSDIPKMITESKNNIFDPENPKDIARTIAYMLSLSETELVNSAKNYRKRACLLFSKEQIVNKYLDLMF